MPPQTTHSASVRNKNTRSGGRSPGTSRLESRGPGLWGRGSRALVTMAIGSAGVNVPWRRGPAKRPLGVEVADLGYEVPYPGWRWKLGAQRSRVGLGPLPGTIFQSSRFDNSQTDELKRCNPAQRLPNLSIEFQHLDFCKFGIFGSAGSLRNLPVWIDHNFHQRPTHGNLHRDSHIFSMSPKTTAFAISRFSGGPDRAESCLLYFF